MKLFWCPQTRAARAVWMLEELGEPYERVLVDIRDPDAEKPEGFLDASPMAKVPALEDGEVSLSESAAICLYVADRYATGRLAPPIDHADRGRFLYWMFFTPAVIEPAMSEKFAGHEPNKPTNGWGDFDSMISTLEQGLEGRTWLVGDDFTAADVMVGSSVLFMGQFGMLPDSPTLSAYAERCAERDAYRKSQEIEAD